MMQWSNLAKCGLFFNIVFPVVHTPLPLVMQHLDSFGIEALIPILQKVLNCRYDLIIGPIMLPSQMFFMLGTGNSQMVPNQRIWRVTNQFKATVTHISHCNHRLVCRSIVLVKQDSLHQFSRPFSSTTFVTSTTFQSPKFLIQCGFICTETMQLVSRKVEFNACQVSLLWHNSSLVSL